MAFQIVRKHLFCCSLSKKVFKHTRIGQNFLLVNHLNPQVQSNHSLLPLGTDLHLHLDVFHLGFQNEILPIPTIF